MISRRLLLQNTALAAASIALSRCASPSTNGASQSSRKKILFFTKSAGFQHSVITRPADDPSKLSHAEGILSDIASKHGFDDPRRESVTVRFDFDPPAPFGPACKKALHGTPHEYRARTAMVE